MKAISLIQPWATLLASGRKQIETRHWSTSYRGPLLVHASKEIPLLCRDLCGMEPFKSTLADLGHPTWSSLPRGAILGAVELTDCIPTDGHRLGISALERAFGDYSDGRFAWLTRHPTHLVVPCHLSGKLGLFDVSEELWLAALAVR